MQTTDSLLLPPPCLARLRRSHRQAVRVVVVADADDVDPHHRSAHGRRCGWLRGSEHGRARHSHHCWHLMPSVLAGHAPSTRLVD